MSQGRLDRIDQVLRALTEMGGKATYESLKQAIVRTTHVSFVTAERYIDEMAAMDKIKPVGAFWVRATNQGEA